MCTRRGPCRCQYGCLCSGTACGAGRPACSRDTSWGIVTRTVGMYQARPSSVSDATASRWRPAGSVRPIRVSREITCLGAPTSDTVGFAPSSQCEPSSFDLIGEVAFHRSDVDGPGYIVGKYQARWNPGSGTCYQSCWHRGAGQLVGPAPMTVRIKVYHTREGSS